MAQRAGEAEGVPGAIRLRARVFRAPVLLAGLAFLFLFWEPLRTLVRDWWNDPDAGHGLLLGPVALWLAWKSRLPPDAPRDGWERGLGLLILSGAILLRHLSGLAAELFSMRISLMAALAGIVLFSRGWPQLRRWWLPAALLVLSIPIPDVVLNSVALPLQLRAAEGGAALLELRHVPVRLAGNVIELPGRSLFVTEACSGLRSLTALLALGVLIGGVWLRRPWTRVVLVACAVPVAIILNSIRVFLTGFLVFYVSPALGEGFLHYSEGWGIFVVALGMLGAFAWVLRALERTFRPPPVAARAGDTAPAPARGGAVQWMPGALLAAGAIFTLGVETQRVLPLRAPLASVVPADIAGHAGHDGRLSDEEVRGAGVAQYLVRVYETPADQSGWFSVYVGYYDQQTQGRTIHSPKNCLPGAGWEVLGSSMELIDLPGGVARVNRYVLYRGSEQALVLYWYQGRGRVQASEYLVKWDLLRDAALRQRSDEALVRVVVPIREGQQDAAIRTARQAAAALIPSVYEALPLL